MVLDGQLHAPAPVRLGMNASTSETGGWVDLELVWLLWIKQKSPFCAGI
jgi:hypothetical protein